MCYKLSNIANKETIELTFNASFKFPKLHVKSTVIDGLQESSVSIIKMSEQDEVSLAIWGLLPKTFQEDWQNFQNVENTLNVTLKEIEADDKYKDALASRRCIILVTGFFTYYLHKGDLYPYYVHQDSNRPFAIAGIYNELEDGFITCSLVVSKANAFIKQIHNSNTMMPLFLNRKNQNKWLDSNSDIDTIKKIEKNTKTLDLKAYPISKEFYKMAIDYDSVLEPVYYNDIPYML